MNLNPKGAHLKRTCWLLIYGNRCIGTATAYSVWVSFFFEYLLFGWLKKKSCQVTCSSSFQATMPCKQRASWGRDGEEEASRRHQRFLPSCCEGASSRGKARAACLSPPAAESQPGTRPRGSLADAGGGDRVELRVHLLALCRKVWDLLHLGRVGVCLLLHA